MYYFWFKFPKVIDLNFGILKKKNLNNLLVSEQDLDKTSQIRVLDISRENDEFKKSFQG